MPNKKVEHSTEKARMVLKQIDQTFKDFRIQSTDRGYKINTDLTLTNAIIAQLHDLGRYKACEVQIRRSGAGVVVIINL